MNRINLIKSIILITLLISCTISINIYSNTKILIGSPIRQKPKILKEFLESLKELDKENLDVDYCFIDDNTEKESEKILEEFRIKIKSKINIFSSDDKDSNYLCDEIDHIWTDKLIWKVARFKNFLINKAIKKNYDYLFLIDSDMVLHPKTLKQLINDNKDIVSCIFWTSWEPGQDELPNAWISDQYNLFEKFDDEISLDKNVAIQRKNNLINKFKKPGVYKVGGLCACTLISKNALVGGVNFNKITNITLRGEDRHFCIRANALGFNLFIDTNFPAYHIYRESELSGINEFKKKKNK